MLPLQVGKRRMVQCGSILGYYQQYYHKDDVVENSTPRLLLLEALKTGEREWPATTTPAWKSRVVWGVEVGRVEG